MAVHVKVTNPEKTDDGTFKSHIDYTVVSTATRGFGVNWSPGTFTVQRRYRDFAWLDALLCDNYPGVIRPPLPANSQAWTSIMGGGDEVVEERRRHLEEYLTRLMDHSELSLDHSVYVFLCCADNASFANFRTESAALAAASRVEALPDAVGDISPAMETSLLSALHKTSLDSKLIQEAASLQALKTKLEETVRQFETANAKQKVLYHQFFQVSIISLSPPFSPPTTSFLFCSIIYLSFFSCFFFPSNFGL
jgi:hypothetical protein